ncbi:MAG: hypothetical protein JWN84_411 [Nocardioides sp.]|nr:hypothetical protein [Nocardioides sp.]
MARALALVVAVLAVALLTVATAAPASAHATLVGTDPAEGEVLPTTPDVVTFSFDEAVTLPADGVQVFDAAGEPVEADSAARDDAISTDLPDTLDDGSYVVVWRAVSADGHPIAGSLTFSIGSPSATVVAPEVEQPDPGDVRAVLSVVHAISYVALLLAAGLVLFLTWTVRGVRLAAAVRRRLTAVVWWSFGVVMLTAVVGLPLEGAYQLGLGLDQLGEKATVDMVVVGDHLLIMFLQLAGFAIALSNLDRARYAVPAAAVAAVSPAIVGHSRAEEPVWLMVTTDVLHLAAGAAWFGGLVGLVLVLRALSGRGNDAALVLSRFSTVAAGLLGLLVVTGSLMGWRILGGWAPLFETTYGRLLLLKIGIAALVALVAGWNRWRLLPATTGAVGHDHRQGAALRVRTAVRAEAVLLVLLLGVTGFLTNQSPRAEADYRAPVASRVEVGVLAADDGTKVLATMTPRTRGPNTITVQAQDQAGEPLDGFAEPTVSVSSADESVDLGSQPVVPTAAGTYVVETVIPAPGSWVVQVSLRTSEFDNPVTTVTFEVT